MSMRRHLETILSAPSPDSLWALHPFLLAAEGRDAEAARDVAQHFYSYLSYVAGKLASKGYSAMASRMAGTAVGTLALSDVLESLRDDRVQTIGRLLSGGLAATLETLATFQHIKAWETEFVAVHADAVWHLYRLLWELSAEVYPDLPVERRAALLDRLLAPVRQQDIQPESGMAVVVQLFQILLAIRVAPLLPVHPAETETS